MFLFFSMNPFFFVRGTFLRQSRRDAQMSAFKAHLEKPAKYELFEQLRVTPQTMAHRPSVHHDIRANIKNSSAQKMTKARLFFIGTWL